MNKFNWGVGYGIYAPDNSQNQCITKEDESKQSECPTCGAEVRVVGDTTKHYEPVDKKMTVDIELIMITLNNLSDRLLALEDEKQ